MTLDSASLLRTTLPVTLLLLTFAVGSGAQNKKPVTRTDDAIDRPAGMKLQPMDVKPGLWQTTTTMAVAGELPVSDEMLSRLTPEQRARMEARMKANSAAHTNTHTNTQCVTKEDLQKYESDFGAARKNGCVPTILSSTSKSAKAKISCDTQGMTGTGTYEVEALDSEHLKGTSHTVMNGNGHTMKVDGTFTSKWVGASCKESD